MNMNYADRLIEIQTKFSATWQSARRKTKWHAYAQPTNSRPAHSHQTVEEWRALHTHPIAVASIVAQELELGDNPIISAFQTTWWRIRSTITEDIKERFGEDVAFYGHCDKEEKEKYEHSKQIDNYRRY